jgi:hypothetical protein
LVIDRFATFWRRVSAWLCLIVHPPVPRCPEWNAYSFG